MQKSTNKQSILSGFVVKKSKKNEESTLSRYTTQPKKVIYIVLHVLALVLVSSNGANKTTHKHRLHRFSCATPTVRAIEKIPIKFVRSSLFYSRRRFLPLLAFYLYYFVYFSVFSSISAFTSGKILRSGPTCKTSMHYALNNEQGSNCVKWIIEMQ